MANMVKTVLKKNFPSFWNYMRTTGRAVKLLPRLYGFEKRHCPICGNYGNFLAEIHLPDIFVYDAICPRCGSNTRNRLLKLAVDEKGFLKPETRVLHFAPESCVTAFVQPRVGEYKTADINGIGVDLTLNIEKIALPEGAFDVIICSHVLEHVDHRKALAELHRVLSPGGVLLALFPIVDAWDRDYENPDVVSERDRGLHFGKENHLRRFGRTVRDEFAAADFTLDPYAPIGPEVVKYGLIPGETLFIGRKA